MTIAFWCVLAAFVSPYLFIAHAKFSAGDFGPKQNHNPREFLERLEGARKRAYWAQQNSYEVNPAFAAAVIIAQLAGATQGTVDGIAIAFVASRLAYGLCYIKDWASARSLIWAFGIGCIVTLFVTAA